jgi:outer membrane protein TolC
MLLLFFAFAGLALAQQATQEAPTLKLEDALAGARQYGGLVQSANLATLQAREDRVQAHAATLPSVTAFNQYINTQGNGTPTGTFVANDGVHIYNEQAVVHEEALMLVRHGEINRAMAAEAFARAKVEVAARGLNPTVIQDYYAIVSAQRKRVNAETSVRESQEFFDLTQRQERGGEVAHADVIKAQIDLQNRQRDRQEAQLAIERAKITLGVLIFPTVRSDFSVVDDLQSAPVLPPMDEAEAGATSTSPDVKAATAGVQEAGWEVTVARYGFLPSLGLDVFYGIDANQFVFHTEDRRTLGYVAQATLNIPVWTWGATRSKVKQAELKRDQAQLDLTLTQRTLQGNVAAYYAEARGAQAQLDLLRGSIDLATESLRLQRLRYQGGEASALEVVDAQNTLTQARGAYDDGLARYRIALANLQSITGTL